MNNLTDIAAILRRDSIIATTEAGSGHPTSCLSAAEIMSVLFFDEMSYDTKNPDNPNNDDFILSKGHAAPILYSALFHAGCIKDNLKDLRKLSSRLEGHPVPKSLPWIKVATGSLGQGLGVGVGIALANKLQKRDARVYVLMGDSEIAEGSIYEALQLATHYQLDNLVAIVDINRLGQRGETLLGHNISSYKKRFKGFGANVITVDGHKIRDIIWALHKARKSKIPTVILAKTLKGKGVSFLEDKENWHGKPVPKEQLADALLEIPKPTLGKIAIKKARSTKSSLVRIKKPVFKKYNEPIATRKVYGETLAALAKTNAKIIALDAETSNSTHAEEVKKVKPNQFIESFIAEQNMVSMALGLSKKSYVPFVSTFAAFFTRAHDQIRMAALSSANMTCVGSHAGVSIGQDGSSQMGLEEIALFRSLPNSTVLYPSDAISAQKLTLAAAKQKGITYIQTTREKTPALYKSSESFPIGRFKVLRESKKDEAVVIGAGITTHQALRAHELLQKRKKHIAVLDLYCIKPFDHKKLISFAKKHGSHIIVAEDNRPEGGIAEMISSGIQGSGIKLTSLAVGEIPHSGTPQELLEKYEIDAKAIAKSMR